MKNAAEGFTQSFVVLGKKSAKLVSGIADVDIFTKRNGELLLRAFLIWNVHSFVSCGETGRNIANIRLFMPTFASMLACVHKYKQK